MNDETRLEVVFFRTESGNEPVREWLKSLDRDDRKIIGEDVKTVQFGWPLGMPLIKKIDADLWEVRSQLGNRIARILFTILDDHMILLNGFIKKTQKMPSTEMLTAKRRMKQIKEFSK